MRSGQLAAAYGVHPETLRYYERRGILPAPPRDRSGYRDYPGNSVQRVRTIKQAQGLGLSLAEIINLLRMNPAGVITCGDLAAGIEPKLAEIDAKIADLRELRTHLDNLLCTCCRGGDPNRPCGQTSVSSFDKAASPTGPDPISPTWLGLAPPIRRRRGRPTTTNQ